MAELVTNFYFTQMRLQDYADCSRRFQLRYLKEQPWPAQIIEPSDAFERHIEQGERFHRLVHQHLIGIPVEALDPFVAEPPLIHWWRDYLEYGLVDVPEMRLPEISRSTDLAGFELRGKFDLIAVDGEGDLLIVDWKTSRMLPSMTELKARLQSRIYPYIIAREGLKQAGIGQIAPDHIRMRYWFANAPHEPLEFSYSDVQFQRDEQYLTAMIHDVESMDAEVFPLTEDARKCRFCLYRSLCDRGIEAGPMDDSGQDLEDLYDGAQIIDIDQIPEVPF